MLKPFIVHIVYNDKFTMGYIELMNSCLTEYEHFFIVESTNKDNITKGNVYYISDYRETVSNNELLSKYNLADKIIISGVFYCVDYLFKLKPEIIKKIYLHFWGGDFYSLSRDHISETHSIKRKFKLLYKRNRLKKLVKKVGGVINLIPIDYDSLSQIMNYHHPNHFIAPMCGNPNKTVNLQKLKENYKSSEKIRVILGNSATITNNHLEVLLNLVRFKNDIIVYCPLSYGDMYYAKKVANAGKELLGDSFIPIFDYMAKENYMQLLYNCDIGIFNIQRQQAMGNIDSMLQFGKKVYIRKNSVLKEYYCDLGIVTYDVESIEHQSLEDFKEINNEIAENNANIVNNKIRNPILNIERWNKVLASQKGRI